MLIDFIKTKKPVDETLGKCRFLSENSVYYQLLIDDNVNMEYNSIDEIALTQLYSSYDLAYGDCILSGLGMGILIDMIISKPNVTRIRVYEKDADVIAINRKFGDIPSKVEIINEPIENMKNVECDCLLFDHINEINFPLMIEEYKNIISNNKPKLVWFWSAEYCFFNTYGDESKEKNNYNDLYKKFLEDISIPGFPNVTEEKMNLYLDKYVAHDHSNLLKKLIDSKSYTYYPGNSFEDMEWMNEDLIQ